MPYGGLGAGIWRESRRRSLLIVGLHRALHGTQERQACEEAAQGDYH
jgi:hypothetical protein